MNKNIWFCMIFVLALPLSVLAQGKGKTQYNKLSQKNVYESVMRMPDAKLGRLLVNSSKASMLGGNCKVQQDVHGSALFTLTIPGSPTIRIGEIKPSGIQVSFKNKKILGFTKIKLPKILKKYPTRSLDEQNVGYKQLGATFKAEIADREWPCGTVNAEVATISMDDMLAEVKFYRDEDSNQVVCIAPNGKLSKIRKPGSCDYEEILKELPPKLCRTLLNIARNQIADELSIGTRKKVGNASGPRPKFPSFLPFTADFRRDLEISRHVATNPDTVSFLDSVQVPVADNFISKDTIDLIESDLSDMKNFASLPDDKKVELTRMALSIEAISGESAMVQPSPELLQVVSAIRPHVDSLIKANPNMELSLYEFPTKADIQENYTKKLAVLSGLWGKPIRFDLNCDKSISIKPGSWVKKFQNIKNSSNPL